MSEEAMISTSRRGLVEGMAGAVLAATLGGIAGRAAAAGPAPQGPVLTPGLTSAWQEVAGRIAAFADEFEALAAPRTDIDRAEGFRLFMRYFTIGLDQYVEYADPAFPAFYQKTRDGVRKFAGDSPGQLYDSAVISPEYEYRVTGDMHDLLMLEFTVYSGTLNKDNKARRRLVSSLTEAEMKIAPDGRFTVLLNRGGQGENALRMDDDGSVVVVRRYLRDPLRYKPRALTIERTSGAPVLKPLSTVDLGAQLVKAVNFAAWNVKTWAQWVDRCRKTKFNRLAHFDDGGDIYTPAGHKYLEGYWSVKPGQALFISFVPPRGRYWSFVPMNYWMESFEWRFGNRVFASSVETSPGPDGRVRLALAHADPGRPDTRWIETMGHNEGQMAFRLARHEGALPDVQCELVTL
ncbi:DUF1214 domain-containing protein [Sphingomonas sp. C3-2]|uniref:DUF1214 domain-containing protein n=1 Tax=Sphingomonas sp. C3-2 TaxID=3062169 RepID=UPI00294A9B97|nr:DUF1214 domain-containing protein [Sphingomonas sp. C3-2]WOK37037.1 DUF1214 domain-containing protein [Sphingomonas sp. C3-2]